MYFLITYDPYISFDCYCDVMFCLQRLGAHNQKCPEKVNLPEALEKYPDSQGKHVASFWRMLPDPPIEVIELLTLQH
jgi:hypothetical protein